MAEQLDPSRIMQIGSGFCASKVLLSAVELELFTRLGEGAMTGASLAQELGLHLARSPTFSMRWSLSGSWTATARGRAARYRNTPETARLPRQGEPGLYRRNPRDVQRAAVSASGAT